MTNGWDYGRDLPPNRWVEGFPSAGGYSQSPIALYRSRAKASSGPVLVPDYIPDDALIDKDHFQGFFFENLHFEAKLKDGSNAGGVCIGSDLHKLVKFHLHAPSEHLVNGLGHALEIHLVHKAPGGSSTVVALLVKTGATDNPILSLFRTKLLPQVQFEGLPKALAAGKKSLNEGFPSAKSHFSYSGSLTTPPCTEGVVFYVLDQAIDGTRETIELFSRFVPGGNNRPIQPLNGRIVEYFQG